MVTRVNGAPAQGFFFSKDVRVVTVTIDTGTTAFLSDLTVKTTNPYQADVVNSDLEVCLEALATRGTVIGLTVASDSVFHAMVDYGQAIDPLAGSTLGNQPAQSPTPVAAMESIIEGLATVTAATITVNPGFAGAALGTPA
jgi:hypothetical protein